MTRTKKKRANQKRDFSEPSSFAFPSSLRKVLNINHNDVGEQEKVLRENEAKPSFLSTFGVFYTSYRFLLLSRNTCKQYCFIFFRK